MPFGMFRSDDGGDTWTKVTGTGFPTGPLGRIAVDVFRQSANIVYATVEGPAPGAQRAAAATENMEAAPAAPAGRGIFGAR